MPTAGNGAASRQDLKDALEPLASTSSSSSSSYAKAIFSPFMSYTKSDSSKMLSELAPVLMTPKMINAAASSSSKAPSTLRDRASQASSSSSSNSLTFSTLGRAPGRLSLSGRRLTARDLEIAEATAELLDAEIPDTPGDGGVSLMRGFNATIPSSEKSKVRRRKTRNVDTPHMGLKELGLSARGMLSDIKEEDQSASGGRRREKGKGRKGRESLASTVRLGKQELEKQVREIQLDKENIQIRRALIRSELADVAEKMATLEELRKKLDANLLKLHEEDLELNDELEGVQEQLAIEAAGPPPPGNMPSAPSQTLRRRKGPAFLPSEHDDLPPGVAFMTVSSHAGPITCLDITEPYGLLVSASSNAAEEGGGARVWDLSSGEELGRLRGKEGNLEVVKCVQIQDQLCITGGSDSVVRVWDLRKVGEEEEEEDGGAGGWEQVEKEGLADVQEEEETSTTGIRSGKTKISTSGPGLRSLEGHSRPVSALHVEDRSLITGASDKTIRQWDLETGQCVLTMDILWAMSHSSLLPSHTPGAHLGGLAKSFSSGAFAVATPPYADGSWDMYEDFVGGLQAWGVALVSGSGDGAVRMWDLRTGQAHRTLMGHTAPVTCVQFDEHYIVSGSLDKSIKVWDLRTGAISDTIRYDYPVTALQFDTRKIMACAGENGIKVYNRTTLQHSTLLTGGHTQPAERLRYIDRYMVSGGRDACVKIWSI